MENQRNFEIKLMAVEKHISDEHEESVHYVFNVFLNGETYEATVSASKVANFSWVEKATHGVARYQQKKGIETQFYKLVHDCIDTEICGVCKKVVFASNGWKRLGNQWIFVTGNGYGVNDMSVFSSSGYNLEILPNLSNVDAVNGFFGMQNIYKDSKIAHWLQIFVCASVCGTLFENAGYPLRSVTAMVGTTNTKKTSVARVFSQFLNVGKGVKVPVTFASTMGGLETFVGDYNDAVLLVDDFMPAESQTEWNEQIAKLKFLVRMYGDGVAKERMATDAKTRRKRNAVSGSCLITAEMLPGIASSQTRIVRLDIPNDGVNLEHLTYYQMHPFILPNFIKIFIEYIATNMVWFVNYIPRMMQFYRVQAGFQTARYNDVYAQMMIILDVLCAIFAGYGLEKQAIREAWGKDIYAILLENDRRIEAGNYARIIADTLHYAIEKSGGTKSLDAIQEWKTNAVYEDEDFFYLTQDTVYRAYCEYSRKMNRVSCLSKSELIKKMKENGVLKVEIDYRGCEMTSLKLCQNKGIRSRFLYVKKSVICGLWEGNEYNPLVLWDEFLA